MLLMTLNR